jgi:hypothetical protein
MKTKEKWKLATIIITIICIVFTPVFIYTEFQRRGYFAFGGEWFLLFLPLAVQGIKYIYLDIKKLFS